MQLVRLRDPENMNLLGLLLGGFFENRLRDPKLARRVKRLSGELCLHAGPLWATLRFDGQGVEIARGPSEGARASVEGEMSTLLAVVTGGQMVWPVLSRQLRIGGDLLFLAQLLPVLAARG